MSVLLPAGASLMSIWNKLFTEHPASVNETYFQHLASAWGFSFRMIGSGLLCLLHGLLPVVFRSRARETICDLHDRMVVNRRRPDEKAIAATQPRAA